MSNSLEQDICPTMTAREQFKSDCTEIFSTPEGNRVLAALCAARHPLQHDNGMGEHDHGTREVVALLWRYGSKSPRLPDGKRESETKPKTEMK